VISDGTSHVDSAGSSVYTSAEGDVDVVTGGASVACVNVGDRVGEPTKEPREPTG
jgi:hypothetical protein